MEPAVLLAWVLITTGRIYGGAGHVAYSPPLATQVACEELKPEIIARHTAARADTAAVYTCRQLPIAVAPAAVSASAPVTKKEQRK